MARKESEEGRDAKDIYRISVVAFSVAAFSASSAEGDLADDD